MEGFNRRYLFGAIFCATLGLMFLEVFAVRVIAITLDDQVIYYVISLAMLGIGSAGRRASGLRGGHGVPVIWGGGGGSWSGGAGGGGGFSSGGGGDFGGGGASGDW